MPRAFMRAGLPTSTVLSATVAWMPRPGIASKSARGRCRDALGFGTREDGQRQGMLAGGIGGGGPAQDIALADIGRGADLDDRGLAGGDGAGFVQQDGRQFLGVFQRFAIAEEDAILGAAASWRP